MTGVASGARRARISTTPAATILAAGGSVLLAFAAHPLLTSAAYAWLLAGLLTAAAAVPVTIDIRVRKLPNRWVAPIAAAAAVQAFAVAYADADLWRVLWPLIVAAIVFGFYVALGLAGMFGFGDAKFAAALSITAAIYAGPLALYLIPIAVLLGGLWRALLTAVGRGKRPRAHGPAIAIAALTILATTIALQQAAGVLR